MAANNSTAEIRLCPCGKPAIIKYCSRRCKDRAWKKRNRPNVKGTRLCLCGNKAILKWCSRKCFQKHWDSKRTHNLQRGKKFGLPVLINKICACGCGQAFYTLPKYSRHECLNDTHAMRVRRNKKRLSAVPQKKHCRFCNEVFIPKTKRKSFCSTKCRNNFGERLHRKKRNERNLIRYWRRVSDGIHVAKTLMPKRCKYCKSVFLPKRSNNERHCSKKCVNRAKYLRDEQLQRSWRFRHPEYSREWHRTRLSVGYFLRFLSRMEATMTAIATLPENDTIPSAISQRMGKWSEVPTEELVLAIKQGFRLIEKTLNDLAAKMMILHQREVEVDIDSSLKRLLLEIGRGTLLASLVVKLAGEPATLAFCRKMPIARQQEVVQMTSTELNNLTHSREKTNRGMLARGSSRNEDGCLAPNFVELAARATPNELASLLVEMVLANDDPIMVVEKCLPMFEEIKSGRVGKKKVAS